MVWFGVTRRTQRLSQLLVYPTYIPEKLSETLKRPHLVLVRTRYQVQTKSGRAFSLFRSFVYLFFACLWSGARKSPQYLQRFSRIVTKTIRHLRCKAPYQAPPAQQAAPVTKAVLFATGWNYRPPREAMKLFRHKIPEEHAQTTLLDRRNSSLMFFLHMIPGMACFLDVRNKTYW